MKTSKKPNGRTGTLLWWPLFLLPLLISSVALIFFLPEMTNYVLIGGATTFGIFLLIWFLYWKKSFGEELLYFAQSFNEIQTEQLEKIDVASVLVNNDLEILWCNKKFSDIFKKSVSESIDNFNEEVIFAVKDAIANESAKQDPIVFEHGLLTLKADIKNNEGLATIWFFDETELYTKNQVIKDMNPVVIVARFDNYEEISSKLDDMQKSVLVANVQKVVSEYFTKYGAIVTSIDKSKYAINLDNKSLYRIREDKFSLLETVKNSASSLKIKPTLSIGVGVGGKELYHNNKLAKDAMSLCLGRGGDQAIVKTPEGSVFYGGKTERQEKVTRIKARNFAIALKDFILEKNHILIMAHKLPDADALGAAIGIYEIAKSLGKKANIVLGEVPGGIKALYENIIKEAEPGEKIIIGKKEALELNKEKTAIIFVDVNRPSIVEDIEVYDKFKKRVVIDHHRIGEEQMENLTLSFIEPYASSASEMVCEILQYAVDDVVINSAEAEALYAGIVIDSDNFHTKTGSRTFEAAAYLQKVGADVVDVRKLLRDTKEEFLAKTEASSSAKVYKEHYAFGHLQAKGLENPTVACAQAANDLLGIRGVKASFVFTPFNGKIYISARSIDEVNVQLVMEKLGGGGHLSVAGAQLEGVSLEEAVSKVKSIIDEMESEGEI